MKRKFLAALAISALCLTACDKKQDSDTVYEKDMPYGATLVAANNFSIPIQYDKRFLTQKLLSKVADYYKSVENTDVSLYENTIYPFYHDYMMQTVYEGKYTDKDLLQTEYDNFKQEYGKNFDFAFIDITALDTDRNISDCASLLSGLDNIAENQGQAKISEKVKDICRMTITVHMTDDGSEVRHETGKMVEDLSMFALNIEDTWYLIED